MPQFSKSIINWYCKYHRDLPWRHTRNPYLIWLSEIILQQTRVDQGLSFFNRFSENFPSINDLANADEQSVLKMWQGLGYYSRARNLHATAKFISGKYGGKFPDTYAEIRSLKGIGDYTAAAISSFAYNLPHAVVDGNVYRVLSRVFNVTEEINSTRGKKVFAELADQLLNRKDPATHNQAVMELGALVCTPSNPSCHECPLIAMCIAREKNLISKLPVKKKKQKVVNRYIEYFVHEHSNGILLRKRGPKDIWQNMYDFPSIEFKDQISTDEVCETEEWRSYFSKKKVSIENISAPVKHILSHQIIHARFWRISNSRRLTVEGSEYVPISDLDSYPLPRLIDRYLEEIM